MKIKNPRLVISAASKRQWPTTDMPEVLMCGRSNVGKSSFINTLVERKNLAYVGRTPGKTRLLNFYNLDNKVMFVDAPGYGHQKKTKRNYAAFGKLMDDYLEQRENLKLCILFLDIRREPSPDDHKMMNYITQTQLPYILVATKCDKFSHFQQLINRDRIAKSLQVDIGSIILFSGKDRRGKDDVWEAIRTIIELEQ